MPRVVALIVTDLERTRLGLPSRVAECVAGRSVLEHTVARVAQVAAVRAIVLVHPVAQDPVTLLGKIGVGKPLAGHADPGNLTDMHQSMRRAARKWSLSAWRGGLAGAGCYDELLPAAPLVDAMQRHKAESALLVGADWPMVDPDLCQRVLDQHLANPEAMAFTFSQAPPGLAGIAVSASLLQQIAVKHGLFGQMLSYNPRMPQADPIGRDVCVQIDAAVRSCDCRFIYDTDRSVSMINAIADRLGNRFASADAGVVADATHRVAADRPGGFGRLPQQVTIELTPQRPVAGPITPHQYVRFDREPMALDTALHIVAQLGVDGDTAVTLGGLGDALLHDDWLVVVEAAHRAGVLGLAVTTDLLVDQPTLAKLLAASLDVVSVRLNADTAHVYESVMGDDRFKQVTDNLQWLLAERANREQAGATGGGENHGVRPTVGMPWIVPHLVKTDQTMVDMETFFDRWLYFAGQAVIEPATTGCGLMPVQSPVRMAPPKRRSCRQIDRRLTILSDGRVAQCDQDWLGRNCPGDAAVTPLAEIWQTMNALRRSHRDGQWAELALCGGCDQWHRP